MVDTFGASAIAIEKAMAYGLIDETKGDASKLHLNKRFKETLSRFLNNDDFITDIVKRGKRDGKTPEELFDASIALGIVSHYTLVLGNRGLPSEDMGLVLGAVLAFFEREPPTIDGEIRRLWIDYVKELML